MGTPPWPCAQAKVGHLETELGLTKAELESAEMRESKVHNALAEPTHRQHRRNANRRAKPHYPTRHPPRVVVAAAAEARVGHIGEPELG